MKSTVKPGQQINGAKAQARNALNHLLACFLLRHEPHMKPALEQLGIGSEQVHGNPQYGQSKYSQVNPCGRVVPGTRWSKQQCPQNGKQKQGAEKRFSNQFFTPPLFCTKLFFLSEKENENAAGKSMPLCGVFLCFPAESEFLVDAGVLIGGSAVQAAERADFLHLFLRKDKIEHLEILFLTGRVG